jgi:transposase
MEDYIRVRRMHYIEGLSIRAIRRQTGFHRDTIRKILAQGGPPGYQRREEPHRPKLGPFLPIIDEILRADRQEPKKQRHTAKRIFDRLREEQGYGGGYTQVKDYVREARLLSEGAFVP